MNIKLVPVSLSLLSPKLTLFIFFSLFTWSVCAQLPQGLQLSVYKDTSSLIGRPQPGDNCTSKRNDWLAEWGTYFPLITRWSGGDRIAAPANMNLGWGIADSLDLVYTIGAVADRRLERFTWPPTRDWDAIVQFNIYNYAIKRDTSSDIYLCRTDTSVTILYQNVGLLGDKDIETLDVVDSKEIVNLSLTITSNGSSCTCYGNWSFPDEPILHPDTTMTGYYATPNGYDSIGIFVLPRRATRDSNYLVTRGEDFKYRLVPYEIFADPSVAYAYKKQKMPAPGTCFRISPRSAGGPSALNESRDEQHQVLTGHQVGETLVVQWQRAASDTYQSYADENYTLFDTRGQAVLKGRIGEPVSTLAIPEGLYIATAIDAEGRSTSAKVIVRP